MKYPFRYLVEFDTVHIHAENPNYTRSAPHYLSVPQREGVPAVFNQQPGPV